MADTGFQKVTISCSPCLVDLFSNFFIERGSNGVVLDNEPQGKETTITAYIDRKRFPDLSPAEIDRYFKAIANNFDNPSFKMIESDIVENKDWLAGWKESFRPIRITRRIVVSPSWTIPTPKNDELIITIDPGAAFGTGHHETTANCIKALEKIGCHNKKVLDYGCGTGILAIAACKLGASRVSAVDNDPEAVECARGNMALNGVDFELYLSADYVSPDKCDLVVANMTTEQIIRSFESLDRSLSTQGRLIISGILNDEESRIRSFLDERRFAIEERISGNEWLTLSLRRA